MVFSARVSKFGRGENLTVCMPSSDTIFIYYQDKGINKKIVKINENSLTLTKENINLNFNELVPIKDNYFLSRIDKSLSLVKYE